MEPGDGDGPGHAYGFHGVRLVTSRRLPYPQASRTPQAPTHRVQVLDGRSPEMRAAFAAVSAGVRIRHSAAFERTVAPDGAHYLSWGAGAYEFLILEQGRLLAARRARGTSAELFDALLLGPALSYALLALGLEPLHATVVTAGDGGVAFLGHSGFGKSSLAASFLQAGHRLVTDDQLVLTRLAGRVCAHPGPPRLKLVPALARRFLGARAAGAPLSVFAPKVSLRVPARAVVTEAVPLRAIYVLSAPTTRSTGPVSIRPLSPQAASLALIRNTFNGRLADPARLARQFAFVTDLVSMLPVRRLTYPRRVSALPAVRAAVLADLERVAPCFR